MDQEKREFCHRRLVLIIDETGPRNSWIVGQVTRVLPGLRGVVRQVQVRTKNQHTLPTHHRACPAGGGPKWTLNGSLSSPPHPPLTTHTHYYTYGLFTHELLHIYTTRVRRLEDGR